MFGNYFKTALRNFRKSKVFSLINIAGLAAGLACFVLIAEFVFDELSYDRYPAHSRDIYRVILASTGNGDVMYYPNVDYAVGPGMKKAFPEVVDFTRIAHVTDFVRYGENGFKEDKLAFADSNFLEMFSIPLTAGDGKKALSEPNSIVVSKAFATRFFGHGDPIGKSLVVGLHNASYKVTGTFDEIPANTHFHFDALLSNSSRRIVNPTWSNLDSYTYLLVDHDACITKLESKFPSLVEEHVVPEVQRDMGVSLAEARKSVSSFVFNLQRLQDIHLRSHFRNEIEPNGDIQYVVTFSILAIFILLLACINFTNLSIARSVGRAKEVCVRKVMGSEKAQLIKQFLSESVLMAFFAMLLAIVLVVLLLPWFGHISGKQMNMLSLLNYRFIISIVALVVAVGLIAGIYPSFYLSAFNPIKVLKGSSGTGRRKSKIRSALIVFQFFVSTALITATLVVSKQLRFMQSKRLGYEKDQVVFLPDARLLDKNQDAFRLKLSGDSRVVAASISRSIPGDPFMDGTQVHPVNENGNGTEIHMNIYHVDYDYLRTLGIQMKRGRYFSKDFPTDSSAGVVINEAAVKQLGWTAVDPIGRTIVRSGQHVFRVIGVVKDFNYESAKQEIAPLMMMLGNNYGGLVIKFRARDAAQLIRDLKSDWDLFQPKGPFNATFLDEKFSALYAQEAITQQVFYAFSLIAMIIAGMGLFGLSAFMIGQRHREIGVRKVLGASVRNLLALVSAEFLGLVAIALLLSIPVSWWALNNWLTNYAYHISLGTGVFLIAGGITLLVAIITISYQTIVAAFANPVKSLRSE